jgi:hypothetical protein
MLAPVKRTRVNPVVLIVLGIALVVGAPAAFLILRSSDDDKKVGSTGLPAGWTTHTVSAEGFKLGLPPEWNLVESLPAGVEFDEYLQANLSQLREVPKVSVSLEDDDVALPGGRAALIRSTFSLNSPDGEREVSVTQYVFLKGSRGFILSMTTTPVHAANYEPLWEQIAKTFEPL